VLEEARRPALERTCRDRLGRPAADLHDPEKLLDWFADVANKLIPGGPRLAGPNAAAEVGPNKCFDMIVQLLDPGGAPVACELAEPHQERHTPDHGTRTVRLLGEPADVRLDRISEPGLPDAINGGWTDEVALDHV
jgi:hypothetical protein